MLTQDGTATYHTFSSCFRVAVFPLCRFIRCHGLICGLCLLNLLGLSKYRKDTQTTQRRAKTGKDTQRRAKTRKDTQRHTKKAKRRLKLTKTRKDRQRHAKTAKRHLKLTKTRKDGKKTFKDTQRWQKDF